MELNTLRARKIIKNGLPGFDDGKPNYLSGVGITPENLTWYNTDYVQPTAPQSDFRGYIPQWKATPQFYGNSAKSLYDPTNLSTEPPTIKDLGIPSGQTYTQLAATPDQKEMITGDTSKGHNFDNGLQSMKTAGKPISYDKVGGALLATAGAVGDVVDAHQYNKSVDQLLNEGGNRGATAAGQGYTWQNDPEFQRELAEVRKSNTSNTLKAAGSGAAAGAAVGSIIPGVGTAIGGVVGGALGAIGGLFGGASRSRKARERLRQAEINAKVRNDFNRDDALTRAIREQNAREIGNPFASTYKYADGKSSFTPFGWLDVVRNAKGSPGEWLVEPGVGAAKIPGSHYKNGKPNTDDSVDINVRDTTAVLSNHGAAQYYEQTGDLNGALITDQIHRMNKKGYKNGKLPGFEGGRPIVDPITSIIPSVFGGIAGLYQYFDAHNQNIFSPNTNKQNLYAQDAFAALNEIKNNPYPTLWQLREAEARTRNALDSSGGLGAGQKMLARIAQQGVTQSQWAKALADTQAYNNAQKMAVNNLKISTGAQDAARAVQTDQWDKDHMFKAHAARQQGEQTGMYNFKNALDTYYGMRFKENQLARMLGLYEQNQALDLARFNRDVQNYQNSYNNPTIPSNVADYYNKWHNAMLWQGWRDKK